MSIFVPFDGSALSRSALVRAREYASGADRQILVFAVVPAPASYARGKGWLAAEEPFDRGAIETRLRACVYALAPSARFNALHVADRLPKGAIANRLRRVADQRDVEAVFLGSENAGRVFRPLSSVGGAIATDEDYDVYIARLVAESVDGDPIHTFGEGAKRH